MRSVVLCILLPVWALLFVNVCGLRADWVAFNDHAPGTIGIQTHSNATTLKIPSTTNGPVTTNLFLKDIVTGSNLPVSLTITLGGSNVFYTQGGAAPSPGTPMANAFNGFVFFGTGPASNVEITNSTVRYTIEGLDPARRYSFIGGANRGAQSAAGSNKFTRVEIQGANSFRDSHSSRVITSAVTPADLASNQVAVNFTTNTVSGSVVDWEDIDPGSDGAFSIVCAQYQGLVPNGGRSNGTNAYPITGIRLEELPTGPPIILAQPQNQIVAEGGSVIFSSSVSGQRPITYQWLKNGSPIFGATASTFTLVSASYGDSGAQFSLFASNAMGTITSSNAILTVRRAPVQLLPVTNLWRYSQEGIELPDSWRGIDYDDSGWPQGSGVFGVETDNQTVIPLINTQLSLTNSQGVRLNTYYFRTHFTLTNDIETISLVASNLIDDGAVFYLNGQEISRINLPNPPAVIRYASPSLAAIEAAWESTPISLSNVVMGDNVLAVEVHQASSTSGDIVMGMRIFAEFPDPTALTITNQPADLIVEEAKPAALILGLNGRPAYVQWYKTQNGTSVLVSNATHRDLVFANVSLADEGQYFAVASNSVNQVTSRVANLTVLIDNQRPQLIAAQAGSDGQTIMVAFSEKILAQTATNIANYMITNVTSGGALSISSLSLTNGTNVLLTLAQPRNPNDNYLLIANNVRDISPQQNEIAPGSAVPIDMLLPLIRLTQAGWAFYNPVLGPPYEPYEPPTNWNQVDFEVPQDDWGLNAAGLFASRSASNPDAPVNTIISGGAISSYYRFPFQFDASPVGARLLMRRIVADGLVGYFNGTEIDRYNLPGGAVDAFTPATISITNGVDSATIMLPELVLNHGSNVFAAELHGSSMSDDNLVFGAELSARILSWPRGPVVITSGPQDITVQDGESAKFQFMAVGASGFAWQVNGNPVTTANTSTLTLNRVTLAMDGATVAVLATNSTGYAMSTNARLHVIADTTPPVLLSAMASTNGIILSFNEPMLASSVTNLSHYQVTNDFGRTAPILTAQVLSPSEVLLVMAQPEIGATMLIINGVQDASVTRNTIDPNTRARIGFDLAIPIDAVWRYNTNGADLGTAWRTVGFPDTTPDWPPGPALIADETGPLPEPIRTPISRFVNGQSHFTFYFRNHFNLPFVPGDTLVTFRHIIDDGALFYVNGEQFHNFNMPLDTSTVNYNTQATTVVGDATYSAAYTATLTNLVAGDNVIAVEVHETGTANSDVTFGAEFSAHIPSIVYPGTPRPKLSVSRNGAEVTVSWSGTGFTLEGSDTVGTNAFWSPLASQTNSYRTFSSASQQFFRLRQ